MSQLKSQEGSYEKSLKDFLPLYKANDVRLALTELPFVPLTIRLKDAVQSLLATYPALLQDLVPRRIDEIDAASTMCKSDISLDSDELKSFCFQVMSLPKDREMSRRRLMRNARDQIDEGLENQRVSR
jgi:hypothetical protein